MPVRKKNSKSPGQGMTAKQKNMDVLDIAQMIEKAEDL